VIGNYEKCYPLVPDGGWCWHSDVCSSMSCNYNFKCDPMSVAVGFEASCTAKSKYAATSSILLLLFLRGMPHVAVVNLCAVTHCCRSSRACRALCHPVKAGAGRSSARGSINQGFPRMMQVDFSLFSSRTLARREALLGPFATRIIVQL